MIKLFAIPMICSVMSGPVMKDVSYHHEYGPKQAVVYDDEEYNISLDSSELNNYTWDSLGNYFLSISEDTSNLNGTAISYNEKDLNFDEYVARDVITYKTTPIDDIAYGIWFYIDDSSNFGKFKYFSDDLNQDITTILSFTSNATFYFNSEIYSAIKSAVQADIQANQTSSMPSIQDLFAQVTSAINAFIGSLGDAFTQVTALFWDSTAATPGPTFLGLLVLIGVGAGLVYAAYRVIKGLLHRI